MKIYRAFCTYWRRYRAKMAPRCGCKACAAKWKTAKTIQ